MARPVMGNQKLECRDLYTLIVCVECAPYGEVTVIPHI